jgi:hypothetical protein
MAGRLFRRGLRRKVLLMFFHEYAITPHVFAGNYCEMNVAVQKDLLYFLKSLRHNGLIADLNKEQWQKEIFRRFRELSPSLRDRLSHLLQQLKKHNRIVAHETIVAPKLIEERDWLEIAIREDSIEPYEALLYTGSFEATHEKAMTVEELMAREEDEETEGGVLLRQDEEGLEAALKDFLLYARKLTIIDPFFTCNRRDDRALRIIAKLYAKRRGERMRNRRIVLHVRFTRDQRTDMSSPAYRDRWIALFEELHSDYGHEITLNAWYDSTPLKTIHDRFMITDQGGLHSGRGFGIFQGESTWSLMSYDAMRKALNTFSPNYNYDLKLAFSIDRHTPLSNLAGRRINGRVKRLLHDNERGKAGFISTELGDHYFAIPADSEIASRIDIDSRVTLVSSESDRGLQALEIALDNGG